eukprot:scaffold256_cov121-Isochrysis_galbana.AAC.6
MKAMLSARRVTPSGKLRRWLIWRARCRSVGTCGYTPSLARSHAASSSTPDAVGNMDGDSTLGSQRKTGCKLSGSERWNPTMGRTPARHHSHRSLARTARVAAATSQPMSKRAMASLGERAGAVAPFRLQPMLKTGAALGSASC